MSFGHYANDWETGILREVFGDGVRSVMFWDADDPEDGFELAVATGADGKEIGRVDSSDPRWNEERMGMRFSDIPGERGETVKFFLEVDAPEAPEADNDEDEDAA